MKAVVFDVDGVLLSEDRCFDVSALVVDEIVRGAQWMGDGDVNCEPDEAAMAERRAYYWSGDAFLDWLKDRGMNSNCDMVHAYLLGLFALAKEGGHDLPVALTQAALRAWGHMVKVDSDEHFSPAAVFAWWRNFVKDGERSPDFLDRAAAYLGRLSPLSLDFSVTGPLYELHLFLFNEWYYGTEEVGAAPVGIEYRAVHKPGFLACEVPLADPAAIGEGFARLKDAGFTICLGTGRSYKEIETPFTQFGWFTYFDEFHLGTCDAVAYGEEQGLGTNLGKPHPFVYYVGAYGRDEQRYRDYVDCPLYEDEIYIVGDSIADVQAAERMGATAVMTLTGLSGAAIEDKFKSLGVEHIVSNILEAVECILGMESRRTVKK